MQRQEVDPYEILGLERGATWAEIRVMYRRLAKKHHPDKNPGDKTSEWIFKEVGRAYERLRKVHGAHDTAGERSWRENGPGGQSVHEPSERRAREQEERDQRERAERVRREQEWAESRERWPTEQDQTETARRRRPLVGGYVGLAVAAIAGVATMIYDRTGQVIRNRAAQSVTTLERNGATARSRSPATARPFPGRVDQGRTPRRGSSRASGPLRPSSAPGDVTTVTGRRAANPPGRNEPLPRTGENATAAAVFTRGSHEDDVLRIQGTPTGIDSSPLGGYETWRYGLSRVKISTGSRRVMEWSDSGGDLKVRLLPGENATAAAVFTRGSHEDDVLRIQGTPTGIDSSPLGGYETWRYGLSRVKISTGSRRVMEWSDSGGDLKVRLLPGENATAAAVFTRGSHEDDVLRIQGTPTGIDSSPLGGYETWRYGLSRVKISTGSRRVMEWSDSGGDLKVRLLPGENATAAAVFTRGSHEDDVLRIQGTPTGIDSSPLGGYETWRYGLSRVKISTGSRRVIEWSDSGGNLKVR